MFHFKGIYIQFRRTFSVQLRSYLFKSLNLVGNLHQKQMQFPRHFFKKLNETNYVQNNSDIYLYILCSAHTFKHYIEKKHVSWFTCVSTSIFKTRGDTATYSYGSCNFMCRQY
jgi:hypothetical protein